MQLGTIIGMIVVAVLFFVLEKFGLVISLGAHPFWATKVTYIGIAIGVVASLLTVFIMQKLHIKTMFLPAGFLMATCVIAAITLLYGKAEFASSYAENAFAGRIWYIGFMAMIGGVFTTLIVFWQTLRSRQYRTTK
ncbi:hypothetical protein [Maritalea sp.]|uniref:hypothetical protein n=1 Tax=Maritalea sp. TaxID=2003361 RepID=UPI003EF3E9B1